MQRTTCVHQLKDIILLDVKYIKMTYRVNAIPIKFQWFLYTNIQIHPKIHMQPQKSQTAKTILKKKGKAGGLTPSNFQNLL